MGRRGLKGKLRKLEDLQKEGESRAMDVNNWDKLPTSEKVKRLLDEKVKPAVSRKKTREIFKVSFSREVGLVLTEEVDISDYEILRNRD